MNSGAPEGWAVPVPSGNRHVTVTQHDHHYDMVRLVGLWCLLPLSTIFQLFIVAVSFIGGGSRVTQRKSPICRKSLTNSDMDIVLG